MLTFNSQRGQPQSTATKRRSTIVIQALLALPPLWLASACADLQWPAAEDRQKHTANAASPTVIAASFDKSGVDIEFDQAMVTDATQKAVSLYRLSDHIDLGNVANASERVETVATWQDSRRLHLTWNLSAGSYVVQITSGALSASGRALDGLAGRGAPTGIHRPDDDFMDGPANYQSQAFHIGFNAPRFFAPPPYAYLSISDVTALQKSSPDASLDQSPYTFWRWGETRVGRYPPRNLNSGWRLRFYSPAGGRYGLPAPADVPRYIKIVNENKAALAGQIIGLGNRRDTVSHFKDSYEVVAAFGQLVTVAAGPSRALDEERGDDDRLWLLLGQDASPRTVTALIDSWDPVSKTFGLATAPVAISGYVHGLTVSSDRSWFDGELAGGYVLRLGSGQELAIADATAHTIYLRAATAAGDCSDCSVIFRNAAERLNAGDQVLLTSDAWYVHIGGEPPSQTRQFFSLNAADLLRSLGGTAFRDRERDGRERESVPQAQDEFVLQVAFRGQQQPNPPYSRLNDGFLYNTAFAAAGLDCLGATAPICATLASDSNCGGAVPAIAHFSFYTADGEAPGEFGPADLVNPAELLPEYVQIFASDGRTPLDTSLSTKVVINSTGEASVATTVLSVELVSRAGPACANGGLPRRGFKSGDILRISHLLRTQAVVEPRTLDGDGDGVALASDEDDWLGVWSDAAQTFVTLERFPQSP